MKADAGALRAILDRSGELAALPHVVFKVLEAADSPTAPAALIERAVALDPGFAARLLAEANSAGFGGARVSSLREAIMRLGSDAVRNLALGVGAFDLFVGRTGEESLRRREWWMASLATAMRAKWLAHTLRAAKPDEAYTGGLLHLVGRTVLDRCGGVPYPHAIELSAHRRCSLTEAEWHVYGAHAGHIGTAAAARWGFPADIASAMNPFEEPPEGDGRLVALVSLASAEAEPPPEWARAILRVSDDDLPTLLNEARAAVEAAQTRLAS